ncbi:MAG: DUF2510 domain-containing protein [Acidimicrobiales bacterium]
MPVRGALRIVLAVLAVAAVAGAVVVVVLPLPSPAVGGTCGPGAGAEPAIAAFFDPASIGAGAEPAAGTEQRFEWEAFVGECQSSSDARMVTAVALLTIAVALAFAVLLVARPAVREEHVVSPPAGWYPDQMQLGSWRWWDGKMWGSTAPPATQAPIGSTEEGAAPTWS